MVLEVGLWLMRLLIENSWLCVGLKWMLCSSVCSMFM